MSVQVLPGDCLDGLRTLADNSVDACVTDPPYGLEFMGKDWDSFKPGFKQPKIGEGDGTPMRRNRGTPTFTAAGNPACLNCGGDRYRSSGPRKCVCDKPNFGNPARAQMVVFQSSMHEVFTEVYRVLKPGAHLLAFSGTRTHHRLACAIEDAGFEIRDTVMWVYGQGFPKSLNVGNGLGTALKPAVEPICLARKPLSEGTVAANVLRWGTGAINVDGCRVEADWINDPNKRGLGYGWAKKGDDTDAIFNPGPRAEYDITKGRWPANLIHDGSDEVLAAFPDAGGGFGVVGPKGSRSGGIMGETSDARAGQICGYGDAGSAARFFYQAKPNDPPICLSGRCYSPMACTAFGYCREHPPEQASRIYYTAKADADDRLGSRHPTVKPVDLMRYLVRLVTPPPRLVCPHCAKSEYEKNSTPETRSASQVRAVRGNIQTEGQQTQQPVLQQDVRQCGNEAQAEDVRVLPDIIPAEGIGTAVLREAVCPEMDGGEPLHDEGVCDLKEGLSTDLEADAPAGQSAKRIHFRASLDDGTALGTDADEGRGRAPSQRGQNGQPNRELGTDAEGRSRQAESAASEHPLLSPLSGQDRHQPACSHCGHALEKYVSVVLDPFAGSGTTGEAAIREGMRAILIEREPDYLADIHRRMALVHTSLGQRRHATMAARGQLSGHDDLPLFAQVIA